MAAPAPAPAMSGVNISKRRKFVADGVFYAELNEFFQRELAEEGYSGVEVRVTPTVTDIIIRATHTQEVLGEQGRRIREVSEDWKLNTWTHTHSATAHQLDHPPLQVSRRQRLSLRRQGPVSWSFCCRSVRVSPLQAPERSCRSPCVLRCPPVYFTRLCSLQNVTNSFSVSSWSPAPRDARLSSPESCAPLVQSQ